MFDNDLSRRQLLVRSAAAAAGLSLSMSILAARKAQAKVDPAPNPSADNDLLNALLGAEYDAVKTYTAGATLIAADTVTPKATRDIVTAVAVHFQDQHKKHAIALAAFITANGGTPVADTKDPTLPPKFVAVASKTTTDVLKLATDKEKAAAFTYANVMKQISTQTAAKLVAAIGGIETQHFVVLYLLTEGHIAATDGTLASANLVVPADFILDVGVANSTNLKTFPALDTLLAFDA